MIQEFIKFLKEFNVVALAIAFIMGAAATALVSSLVKDVIMPIISPIFSSGIWQSAMLNLGSIHIAIGSFLGELINFLVIALVVYFLAKKLLKIESK